MNDAVKILQGKLASGEISEDEYKRKLALISEHLPVSESNGSKKPTESGDPQINPIFGWVGIISGIVLFVLVSKAVKEIRSDCLAQSGDVAMCSEYAVDGTMVSLAYVLCAAAFIGGIIILAKGRK